MPIKRVETGSQIPLSAVLKEEVDHAAIAVAADDNEVRKLVGADGSVDGQEDKVLGWFHVGVTEKYENYKGRRAPIAEKLTWIE